ncbi:MAG: hypothetical protein ABJ205_03750 [Erythrobacter sp.]|uniref:hypothetical protein n=1 Tax=Erythrobacter sp. TaxID=1042 RepID=UPI003265DB1B
MTSQKKTILKVGVASTLLVSAGAALSMQSEGPSEGEDAARPEIYSDLLACRAVVSIEERVRCYDQQVDAFSRAEESGELVIADKEQVEEARRGLFGFTLPRIGLFGGGDKDSSSDAQLDEIEAKVMSARRYSATKWEFRLDDGSVWRQTDASRLYEPSEGDRITIKRASLGSFKARLQGQGNIRVRRHK